MGKLYSDPKVARLIVLKSISTKYWWVGDEVKLKKLRMIGSNKN